MLGTVSSAESAVDRKYSNPAVLLIWPSFSTIPDTSSFLTFSSDPSILTIFPDIHAF